MIWASEGERLALAKQLARDLHGQDDVRPR